MNSVVSRADQLAGLWLIVRLTWYVGIRYFAWILVAGSPAKLPWNHAVLCHFEGEPTVVVVGFTPNRHGIGLRGPVASSAAAFA